MKKVPSENLLPCDGKAFYFPDFFDGQFRSVHASIEWESKKVFLFGKWVNQPRLMAWYGDQNAVYTYSGLKNNPKPWNDVLTLVRQNLQDTLGVNFNSVLCNLYRDGNDSMGWHQDNEPELGAEPVIASVSLGATRRFRLRHKFNKAIKPISIDLEHGSLLVMQGKTQEYWQHQIPKTKRSVNSRINLTYRNII